MYWVSATVRKVDAQWLHNGIVKNGIFVAHIYEDISSNELNTIRISALVDCSAGDYISVEEYEYSGWVDGDADIPYSTLTVMLMYEGNYDPYISKGIKTNIIFF